MVLQRTRFLQEEIIFLRNTNVSELINFFKHNLHKKVPTLIQKFSL